MVTLKVMRAGIVTALKAALGTDDQQILPYVIRDPALPTIWVRFRPDSPILYHQALGPAATALQVWEFLVEAYCGDGYETVAQERLDEYVGPGAKSVVAALEADNTLGGTVQNLKVVQCNNYVEFVRADGNLAIGANWQVEIYP